jgi:hypothetical protein
MLLHLGLVKLSGSLDSNNAHKYKLIFVSSVISLFLITYGNEYRLLETNAVMGGKDTFTVAVSVKGVKQEKTGDLVSIVSVNNQTQVTNFDAENLYSSQQSNATYAKDHSGTLQYFVAFPNVTVNTGAEYNVCVYAVKSSTMACKGGANSPINTPEVVDLTLG